MGFAPRRRQSDPLVQVIIGRDGEVQTVPGKGQDLEAALFIDPRGVGGDARAPTGTNFRLEVGLNAGDRRALFILDAAWDAQSVPEIELHRHSLAGWRLEGVTSRVESVVRDRLDEVGIRVGDSREGDVELPIQGPILAEMTWHSDGREPLVGQERDPPRAPVGGVLGVGDQLDDDLSGEGGPQFDRLRGSPQVHPQRSLQIEVVGDHVQPHAEPSGGDADAKVPRGVHESSRPALSSELPPQGLDRDLLTVGQTGGEEDAPLDPDQVGGNLRRSASTDEQEDEERPEARVAGDGHGGDDRRPTPRWTWHSRGALSHPQERDSCVGFDRSGTLPPPP